MGIKTTRKNLSVQIIHQYTQLNYPLIRGSLPGFIVIGAEKFTGISPLIIQKAPLESKINTISYTNHNKDTE